MFLRMFCFTVFTTYDSRKKITNKRIIMSLVAIQIMSLNAVINVLYFTIL